MNCPTCGKSDFMPPWLKARLAGFDSGKDCVLMANRFGKVFTCIMLEKLGRFDCAGGECKLAARYTKIVTDKFGRQKEVFNDPEIRPEGVD